MEPTTPTTSTSVKWTLLTLENLEEILEVNTKSFTQDPYLNYMFHEIDVAERLPFIKAIQKAFIKQTIGSNQSYCLGDITIDGIKSLVLMLPPRVPWPEDLWDIYTKKQEKLLLDRGLTVTYERFIALEEYFSERFAHYDSIEGYYLLILSTDEKYRGQGLATKIMEVLFEKLDSEQKTCYLECTSAKLVPFYSKLGFTALEKDKLPLVPADINPDLVPSVTFFRRTPKPITTPTPTSSFISSSTS
ncbi:hypothetical protein PPL_01913 [Heterostelium album PN500]|uniref:N-acetyltransferase domain-containing protein n=1 Tax=Heterostelium pallidum (strain ATCC 26659 / Pp 5 / PN500) TaxID=670386 RepID=D3B0U6_HETP5|nr:hypothetical protein PPL_01913 [Heterostelium album PN500]EFA84920.1 hypothetical protein PPL_01913 [Heterostelium album PN500]|eukprot:XP_020437030.1 hypothetical protein PPL_01913 [Heterostelium album PN500]